MAKVYEAEEGYYLQGHPGHTVFIPKVSEAARAAGRGWNFNGDFERPTFTPSVLESPSRADGHHFFVTDGRIQYLSDKRKNPCCQGAAEWFDIPDWETGKPEEPFAQYPGKER